MPQCFVQFDLIAILAADFFSANEALLLQVLDDPLHGPFGDADTGGDLAEDKVRLAVKRNQHVHVIGEKRPAVMRRR